MGNRKSLLARVDKGKSAELVPSKNHNQNISNLQVYKDVNALLGKFMRMGFGFVGIDIDKYASKSPGMKRVHKNVKKKQSKSWLGRIGG